MKLIPNWKQILTRSFSMWFTYVGVLLILGPEALFAISEIEINPYTMGYADLSAGVLVVLGRVLDQGIGDA